jgi:hypothetical protein
MEGKSFDSYYNGTLLPVLEELESIRSKVRKNVLIGLGIGIFIAVAIFLYASNGMGVFLPIIGAVIGFAMSYKDHKELKLRFKKDVIANMVRFIDETLIYDPKGKITEKTYKKSKLFTNVVDKYKGDDYVQGKLGSTQIEFSELHTQYKTIDKDGKTQWHTIFKGIFFNADFNKEFNGEIFVEPDIAEKLFGSFGGALQGMNKAKGDLVKMENVEFEKEFVVYASDQVEARYVLSTKLLQRILDFKNKTGKKIFLSFIDSSVFVAISLNKNLFEISYFKSLLNRGVIDSFYSYLELCVSIVEDLDLNTRIWTKK